MWALQDFTLHGPAAPPPPRLSVAPPSHALHPSLHAALAWRYAQLLAALPNRGGEADAWERAARALWGRWPAAAAAGGGSGDLEGVLGNRAAFTGKGSHGCRCAVSLLPRRLLVGPVGSSA
jgi:hypothetical protein